MKLPWKTCFRLTASAFILYLCIHYWGPATRFLGAVLGAASPILTGPRDRLCAEYPYELL